MNKTHKLKPVGTETRRTRYGYRETFCGLVGHLCLGFSTEFESDIGRRFEAMEGKTGVTCSVCRKGRWNRSDDAMGRPFMATNGR